MAIEIKVGDEYNSFADVQKLIATYEKIVCVNYYISDSKKLESAAKNAPKIVLKANKKLV